MERNVINDLQIKDIDIIINKLKVKGSSFIGLEDPDIFIDNNGKTHVYFTIAYKINNESYKLYLGHAEGESLDNLRATDPVISNNKEIAISPIHNNNYRYILAESWEDNIEEGISLLKTENMSKEWIFDRLVFNPKKQPHPWCAGYASPCKIVDRSIMIFKDKFLLGICNGNSGIYEKNGKTYRGDFEPGIFLFNYETGDISWIDNQSLFKDPKANTITFASELVCLNDSEAILYAHPNDSFVRAYKINLRKIKEKVNRSLQF